MVPVAGPDMRMTATPDGRGPELSATIVSGMVATTS
jgi:hypothetical protein